MSPLFLCVPFIPLFGILNLSCLLNVNRPNEVKKEIPVGFLIVGLREVDVDPDAVFNEMSKHVMLLQVIAADRTEHQFQEVHFTNLGCTPGTE